MAEKKEKRYVSDNAQLMTEWDYNKNTLLPERTLEHSNKIVWWICKICGHEWQAKITLRSYGTGCPICAEEKRKQTKAIMAVEKTGSLAEHCPDLAAQWNYEMNGSLLPSQITQMSNKVVWWKCSIGHTWEASAANRSKGQGCPYCSGRRVLSGFNDLLTRNPTLAAEWNYDRNGKLSPIEFTAASKQKVWWKCPVCDYEWEAIIGSRNAGRGCPACANRVLVEGTNDLATRFPQLIDEWDYSKNHPLEPNHVMPGSHNFVWWKCKDGHSWRAKIANRAILGRGCPYCSGRNTLIGENDLAILYPELADEWDIEMNSGHSACEFKPQSNKKVWWKCKNGHSWKAAISGRTINGLGCPYCSNRQVLVGYNDLTTTNPDLAAEWDFDKNVELSPSDFTAGSDQIVWWKCKNGHSWKARIYSRGKYGTGCPTCFSTLQRSFPEAALFYYLSNIYDCVEANKKFDWLPNMEIDIYLPELSVGIEYDGSAWHKNSDKDIRKNQLCQENGVRLIRLREPKLLQISGENIILPSYSRESLAEGIQNLFALLGVTGDINLDRDEIQIRGLMEETDATRSLSENAPEWLDEWDVKKNGTLTPAQVTYASGRKIWWKCKAGHSWKAPVYSRQAGSGCPYCSNHRHGLILCEETGKTYQRYEDVALDLGISIASVSLVVNGKQKSVKGYHLKFICD